MLGREGGSELEMGLLWFLWEDEEGDEDEEDGEDDEVWSKAPSRSETRYNTFVQRHQCIKHNDVNIIEVICFRFFALPHGPHP